MHAMYAFSKSAGKWLRLSTRRTPPPVRLSQLRVATFNVWFDAFQQQARCDAVLNILAAEAPDVIALEEVTPPFLNALLAQPWVREHYVSSRARLLPGSRYDVVMLSRLPVARFTAHTLTTDMGRKLHALTIPTTRGPLVVAGIHLESMKDRTPTRLRQIDECLTIFDRAACALWMGDFNAAPGSEEDARICGAFRDLWQALSDAPGYTRDTTANAMLAKVKADRHQRIDRVFLRGKGYQPLQVRMLGTTPLPGTDGQVFPSDHFGLIAELGALPQAAASAGE